MKRDRATDVRNCLPFSSVAMWLLFVVLILRSSPCIAQSNSSDPAIAEWPDPVSDQATRIFGPLTSVDSVVTPRLSDPGYWYHRHLQKTPFRLRGRIDYDVVSANQSGGNRATFGELSPDDGFRRARIGAEGDLPEASRYVFELDFAAGDVVLRDGYYAWGDVQESGEVKAGHMREPFSLEGGTSANSFAFMERSMINTLDPARNWGLSYHVCGTDENWTFSGGLFQAGTSTSDLQFGPGTNTALTAKVTGLALNENHGQRIMHFGLALSERVSNNGVVSINQQPRSPLLTFGDSTQSPFIPRLTIPANFEQLINVQWVYADGPFWSQAEWYASLISQIDGPLVYYHGAYLDGGYFFGGGHRKYDGKQGFFGAVVVDHPISHRFSSKEHEDQLGWGAWEGTIRMAYVDFVDNNAPPGPQGQATGAMLPQMTAGMNWYLADRMRVMFNFNYGYTTEANTGTSSVSVIGMRFATFW